jgi:hypothetical protein
MKRIILFSMIALGLSIMDVTSQTTLTETFTGITDQAVRDSVDFIFGDYNDFI